MYAVLSFSHRGCPSQPSAGPSRKLILCKYIHHTVSFVRTHHKIQILSYLWRKEVSTESIWNLLDIDILRKLWMTLLQYLTDASSTSTAILFVIQHQRLPPDLIHAVIEPTLHLIRKFLSQESNEDTILLCLQVCCKVKVQCTNSHPLSSAMLVDLLDIARLVLMNNSTEVHKGLLEVLASYCKAEGVQALPSQDEGTVTAIMTRLR